MKQLKQSLTIGIPAYNEESNIAVLLKQLLKQKQTNFIINQITVVTDGSTDKTVNEVNLVNSKIIKLIIGPERRGKANRLNQITNNTYTDILVLLDADIYLSSNLFLEKLVNPIIFGNKDLTCSKLGYLKPTNLVDKILALSIDLKYYIYENINSGINIFTCHGGARAFSKKLYSKISFNNADNEDSYSFLFCIKNKFEYFYVKNTTFFIKLPENIYDHYKQSIRFSKSIINLSDQFGINFVKDQYKISTLLFIRTVFKFFIRSPFFTILYIMLTISAKLFSPLFSHETTTWNIALSTKSLGGRK